MNLKKVNNPKIIKIGFSYDDCYKNENIITGKGYVYYYKTQKDYDLANEYSIVDFDFKFDIDRQELFDIKSDYKDAKNRVEANEDDFIDNLICNLLPQMESEEMEMS